MMDISIKKAKLPAIWGVETRPPIYWASLTKEIIYFHLVEPKEIVETIHFSDVFGWSIEAIPIDELSIKGIVWESVLISIYRMFGDLGIVHEFDRFGLTCEFIHRIISNSWRSDSE